MIWPGADWSAWLCQDGFQDYKLPGDVFFFKITPNVFGHFDIS